MLSQFPYIWRKFTQKEKKKKKKGLHVNDVDMDSKIISSIMYVHMSVKTYSPRKYW